MRRPRIGIPLDLDPARGRYELPRAYGDAVREAGGLPLPLCHGDASVAGAYLALLDGLVLPGGDFDIEPERYGEARRPACGPARPERTAFEWALLEAALADRLPVLGVCGGMQLMDVVRGGRLHQDLREELGVDHEQPPPKDVPSHEVRVAPGTRLARLVGEGALPVNSTHHQAVSRAGEGVLVSARAPDGVVEALELPELPFAVGVQWHPEAVGRHEPRHLALYRGLVEAARERLR